MEVRTSPPPSLPRVRAANQRAMFCRTALKICCNFTLSLRQWNLHLNDERLRLCGHPGRFSNSSCGALFLGSIPTQSFYRTKITISLIKQSVNLCCAGRLPSCLFKFTTSLSRAYRAADLEILGLDQQAYAYEFPMPGTLPVLKGRGTAISYCLSKIPAPGKLG